MDHGFNAVNTIWRRLSSVCQSVKGQLFSNDAGPYLGSAGGLRAAAAFMTGNGTRVAAVWTRQRAALLAAVLRQAVAPVADPSASVDLARQRLVAHQAARNVLQVTGDVAALL